MPNINEFKESKYVKKEDVGDGIIVTIDTSGVENVGLESNPENKLVLHFQEDIKPLVMNWTNLQLCAQATGSDNTDDWEGKKIVLYNDPNISFQGKLTGGVRIKPAKQSAPKPAPSRVTGEYNEITPPPTSDDQDIPF